MDANGSAIEQLTLTFSEPVDLTPARLKLTRDAGANLLTGSETLTPTPDHRTWTLSGLSTLTAPAGSYQLTFPTAADRVGNPMATGTIVDFVTLSSGATRTFTTSTHLAALIIGDGSTATIAPGGDTVLSRRKPFPSRAPAG